jgi:hypothetical protein
MQTAFRRSTWHVSGVSIVVMRGALDSLPLSPTHVAYSALRIGQIFHGVVALARARTGTR